MEEVTELVGRIKNGGKLPLITSCSPGLGQILRAQLSGIPGQPFKLQVAA
jgi:hypothetical protein